MQQVPGDSVLKHRIRCGLILVAGLAVAVGCGKDGGTGPVPDYSLSLAPAALTVVQGATGTATVTITRMNFPGAVPLHLGNAPAGVTGSFNPNPVAPTGTSSTLTVSVGAAVAPGIYNLTVNGTGSPGSRSTVLTLTVSPASDYTLSLSPATLTIAQGATGTATVTITRTNFTGAVTLSLGNAPAGATGAFDPAAPTGTSSTLTVSVGAAVTPGVYNLTVDGTATAGNRSTPLTLTVSATPDYALSLSPTALTITQGATGTATVTITRTNFTGAVTLSLGNAPPGVTGAFAPAAPTGTSSTLTVSVGAAVTPGVYNLTVDGTATAGNRSTPLTLTVSATPDYALSLSPTALTITQGATGTATVTITRTNFTGAVTLSLGNAPAGVTGAFDPAVPTGTSSTLTVSVGAAVTPGVYNLTVEGTATAGNRSTPLTLTVSAVPDYALSLTPAALTIAQGANATTTVTITRTNFTGAVTLSLGGAPAGVTGSFDPAAPTGTSSTLTVSVGAAVAPGVYNLTVDGTATAGNRSTPLALTVSAAPSIALAPTSVTFSATAGGSNPAAQTIAVTNGGGGTLSGLSATVAYTAGQPTGWLTPTLSATTAPANLELQATTGTLSAGTYTATVAVASSVAANSPQNITVTFTVSAPPAIALAPTSVTFSATVGGANPVAQTVSVSNSGGGTLSGLTASVAYTAGEPTGWLTATLSAATAPSTLTLTAMTGSLAAESYTASVAVASPGAVNSPQTVSVTFTVNAASAYTLALNPNELAIGQGASGTTTVTITRTDFTGAVTLTLEGAPAGVTGVFNPTPALGTSSQLTLSVGAAVASDTYILTVRGAAPGLADRTATLFLNVAPAYMLALNPNELTIGQGASGTTTVTITRTDFTGAVTLTLEGAPAGVTGVFNPTPALGTSSQLTLSVGATTEPGDYTLTVRGTATGLADRTVAFRVDVASASAPAIGLAPTSLSFTATQDAAGVPSQSVSISNGGTGTLSGLSIGTITYGAGASGWLEAPRLSATTAFPTAFVRVDVRTIDLQPGTYTATIPVQSAVASNSPQNVTVTYTVTPPAQCPTTGAPAISVGQTLTGTIATTDCVLTTGQHADVYLLTLAGETDVQIDLTTTAFTSGLRLRDAATGFIVAQGSTPLQSSRLTRRLRAGTFVIEAFARSATAVGTYQLAVAPAPVPIPLDGFWLGTAADGNTISLLIELNTVVFFFADLGRLDISGGLSCYLATSTSASAQIVANSFSFPWLSGTFNTTVTGTVESPTTASGTIGTMTLNEQPCETLTISGTIPSRTWTVTKR